MPTFLKNRIVKNIFAVFVFLSFCFLFFARVEAASLTLSPLSGSYAVGENFSASVYVSSSGQTMNAASGVVSFPTDKLEVVSISKSGSIFSLWVQEPSYSNAAGIVSFEGIVLNPGYIGNFGKILNITFKAKSAGVANLNFSSGSILANDGSGTNILTELSGASFSLGIAGPGVPEAITPYEIPGTPSAPKIKSPTHPDPNRWYAQKYAKFEWDLPSGVTGTRLLASKIPQAIPVVAYIPPISHKEINDYADGVWYFSARLENEKGWGAVSYFRFQIDAENPYRFDIEEIKRDDMTEPNAKFIFTAEDKTSGISHFEITIDDNAVQKWSGNEKNIYTSAVLEPGTHKITAKAFDKAGNYLANFKEFKIEPLELPKITQYPKKLQAGEIIVIGGQALPDSKVAVFLQRDNDVVKTYETDSNSKGEFTLKAGDKSKDGIYKAWAKVTDKRGSKSLDSEKITFSSEQMAIIKIGYKIIMILAVIIPLVALILGLIFLVIYWRRGIRNFKARVGKETAEAENVLHKAFEGLKETVKYEISRLEKNQNIGNSTAEEEKVIKKLKQDLDNAEMSVSKEIEDINREIKNSR